MIEAQLRLKVFNSKELCPIKLVIRVLGEFYHQYDLQSIVLIPDPLSIVYQIF